METAHFTKRERYLLKKRQKLAEHQIGPRRYLVKKIILIIAAILIFGGGIFGAVLFLSNRSTAPKSASELKTIAKAGMHWHANLSIKILDQYQSISSNIGIGITHLPVHTHEADGVMHMEFSGAVREDDIRLGRFFENWNKDFNKDCVLDKCNGSDGRLRMLVNGEENFEFENYSVKDKDKIEIIFE